MCFSPKYHHVLNGAHHEITTWKKNIFDAPRGKGGKDFIAEVSCCYVSLIKRQDGNP